MLDYVAQILDSPKYDPVYVTGYEEILRAFLGRNADLGKYKKTLVKLPCTSILSDKLTQVYSTISSLHRHEIC